MDSSDQEEQKLNFLQVAIHALEHTHKLAVKSWSGVLTSAGIESPAEMRRGKRVNSHHIHTKKITTQSKLASYKLLLHSQ